MCHAERRDVTLTAQVLRRMIAQSIGKVCTDWEIYEEEIPPERNGPYFLIKETESSLQLVMGRRYKSSHNFEIRCVPEEGGAETLQKMAHVLFEILEYIHTEEGILRGSNFKTNSKDGGLHFYVSYEYFLTKPGNRDNFMEQLTNKISKKG